jgi:hypothetical protein
MMCLVLCEACSTVQVGWPALDPIADHAISKYESAVAGVVAAAA